ncbi:MULTISPECIES: L-aspartate oxidase [unclassified Leisingera]|uniref:L-aspartate oxidase n=1 Tax=unclassified Leisingera TaxID=2614906 RepID=UPI0002FA0E94|nr:MULTISPECIES: L-aspartate oxidase [unclassified Leisingera]KIC24711.1 L-aspartate oxidase [Leisingera sp. ANG-S3]KIC31636.1 L-aspartate oxidase [Leisingera sp. ANG-S5]KIC55433.1 L-aspartate oxidase [Leisingera sp. ANG-S]KID09165.1 L-aspartate oxidase [Leisingera sp. ANG1]
MIETSRIVIAGAGLGALYAALELAPRPVLVISPELLGEGASSAWAQGGVAAAMASHDTPEAHAEDTLQAGAGTVDPEVAAMVTRVAREHIIDLTELGAPFDRDAHGNYVMSREAAHSAARVVRVKGDQAGGQIMQTLIAAVRAAPSVQVLENTQAVRLETDGGAVSGIWINRAGTPSAPVLIKAPGVLLAGGGSGGLYAHTTNPPRIRGQVIGFAARAGASIADPEFVQFHPTAFDIGEDPAPLATEALRGEGAVLVNAEGERFMLSQHPDAELAPRDIVARAIFAETQAGRRPMLDTREALGAEVLSRFPTVAETCARAGINPVQEPIPVAVAAHYHMGGVDADMKGRTSLANLWVCGEASSTGLHGANRLASNGLLEALVYARNAARDMASMYTPAEAEEVVPSFSAGGKDLDPAALQDLRETMTTHAGVRRTGDGLKQALAAIARLEAEQSADENFTNMCATATLIAAAALRREESRGGHFRDDFPEADPEQAHRTRITLNEALAIRAKAAKELS